MSNLVSLRAPVEKSSNLYWTLLSRRLKRSNIFYKSGINLPGNAVEIIKDHAFKVLDVSVGGDAPKDVVKIYQYNGVDEKYRNLMIKERRELIKETLELRLTKLQKTIKNVE